MTRQKITISMSCFGCLFWVVVLTIAFIFSTAIGIGIIVVGIISTLINYIKLKKNGKFNSRNL